MNLPNKLTLFRICLVPFFIFFMISDAIKFSAILSLVIFVVASLTDLLDGYLARKKNIVTDFGKLMDPLADKMLVMSALIIFISQNLISSILVIIIVSRDLMIDSIRLLAANKGKVIAADIWGKLKTFFQMVAIITLLLSRGLSLFLSELVVKKVKLFGDALMVISVVLTVVSAVNYILKNREFFKAK